jgi:HlyD family secretion protein
MTPRRRLATALALAASLLSCRDGAEATLSAPAHRGDFEKIITGTGLLQAAKTLTLQAPTEGKIAFMVPEGNEVKAGDPVFGLETKEIENQLDSALLDLAVADSGLGKADEDLRSEHAKNDLSLRERHAELDHAQIGLKQAEDALEKKKRQVANKIAPAAEIPQAELELEQAKLQVENAQIGLERLQDEITSRAETLKLDRQAAQARFDKAQAQVKDARDYLEKATVKAERDGIVVHARNWRNATWNVGDQVWQGTAIVELPDLSVMEVQLPVNEADISLVKIGTPARIHLEAWPDLALTGKVSEIGGVAKEVKDSEGEGTGVRVFDASVALDAQDPRLRPGMTARVELVVDRRPSVLLVPVAAIEREGPASFVRRAGKRVPVEVATASMDWAVVTSGLEEGDVVDLRPREATPADAPAGASASASAPAPPSAPPAAPAGDAVPSGG